MPEVPFNGMYYLEPLVKLPSKVELPSSSIIYRVDPLLKFAPNQTVAEDTPDDEAQRKIKDLSGRQEAILKRLQGLQQQLNELKTRTSKPPLRQSSPAYTPTNVPNLNESCSSAVREHHAAVIAKITALQSRLTELFLRQEGSPQFKQEGGICHDIVIRCHPQSPPYSILAFAAALRQVGLSVTVSALRHSSLSQNVSVPSWPTITVDGAARQDHQVALTVLWSDVPQPTLMVSPLQQCPVMGEGNIVRYLCRLFPSSSEYCYECRDSLAAIASTDVLLDECTQVLTNSNDKKIRSQFLSRIQANLKNKGVGAYDAVSTAMLWSTLKQLSAQPGVSLQPNAAQWVRDLDLKYIGATPSDSTPSVTSKSVSSSSKKQEAPTKDGSLDQVDKDQLISMIGSLGWSYQLREHSPVMTVEELMGNVDGMPGLHMKNLFLKDKKKQLYLVSARHNAKVQLNSLAKLVGCKDLRFADEGTLLSTLGVRPGHVNAYALINDKKEQKVKFILDDKVKENADQFINFHPMVNSFTLGLKSKHLLEFIEKHTLHTPLYVTLEDD